jgi:Trypsin-like peptidase domain
MRKELKPSEKLMYSTIRIECVLGDGNLSRGTGFLYAFNEDDEGTFLPCLVTNKHVVEDAVQGHLLFTKSDSDGNPLHEQHIREVINDFERQWINHPDEDVDLCVLPIGAILNSSNQEIHYTILDSSVLPSDDFIEELSAVEDILMVGYPNGLWDHVNNLPIIRKGITASHPKFNHNGRKDIIIDAACFPGSSGFPILINNEGSFVHNGQAMLGNRTTLLGILYAGPQFTATGEIRMLNIPTRPVSQSQIPMNLGYAIKAERIRELDSILKEMFAENRRIHKENQKMQTKESPSN